MGLAGMASRKAQASATGEYTLPTFDTVGSDTSVRAGAAAAALDAANACGDRGQAAEAATVAVRPGITCLPHSLLVVYPNPFTSSSSSSSAATAACISCSSDLVLS